MTLRHELAIVLLLLLVAAPTRLLWLDVVPPGLFHDEAYEGIDAVRIAAGARPVFLPENYGREPLYAYLMAGLFKLAGPTALALRATSAIFGTLCIPAAYFWARVHYGPTVGLVTAALTAASYWMLQESRLGMRPIALPAGLALTAGLTWLAARERRAWAWPLAGLCLGVAQYTYLPAHLFPVVVLGEATLGLWAGRRERGFRLGLIGLAVLIAVATLVATPLGHYFATNPEAATARGNAVSIFASGEAQADPIGALGRNLALNLGMFVWRGDDTLRHNLPERAVFDPLLAPFFLLGVALSLRAALAGKVEHAALWLWLGVMLLPGLLSDSAPHFLRTIGLLPALFTLPAQGLIAAAEWLTGRLAEWRAGLGARPLAMAPVVGVVLLSQSMSLYDYFVRFPAWPGLAETFDAPRAELARVAGDPPADLGLTLPTPGWSYATIRFLRPKSFQPPDPPPAQPAQARFGSNVVLL